MVTIIDTQEDYKRAYKRILPGNRHKALLYSTYDATFADFHSLVSQGWAIELSYDRPTAIVWIDTFNGKTAFIHFCFYAGAEYNVNRVLIEGLNWAFDIGQRTALFGITPKVYRHVFRTITGPAGFKVILEETDMCYIARKDRFTSGVITRLDKETWNIKKQILEKLV